MESFTKNLLRISISGALLTIPITGIFLATEYFAFKKDMNNYVSDLYESYPEAIKYFPSIKVAKYSPLTALYLTKSTSKIFEVNEYLELKNAISDFTDFLKEKYDELFAEFNKTEPIRLLRVERDKKLQESDWRTNNDYPYDDADAWATYRTQLRNLPAEISAGNVTAPILQNGTLIFDWPQVPNA